MKFRIRTILWVFALLASALATFGGVGLLIAAAVIGAWSTFGEVWFVPCAFVLMIWWDYRKDGRNAWVELGMTVFFFGAFATFMVSLHGLTIAELPWRWETIYGLTLFLSLTFAPCFWRTRRDA